MAKIKSLLKKKKSFKVTKTPKVTVITHTYRNGKFGKPKETQRPLSKVEMDLLGPKALQLLKSPSFKENWEAKKDAIIDKYKNVSTPPFTKIIKDKKSGLVVLISASPKDIKDIRNCDCEVFIQTMLGDIHYVEHITFSSLKRACEHVQDFNQAQSERFCQTAIRKHKRAIVAANTTSLLLPNLRQLNEQVKTEQKRVIPFGELKLTPKPYPELSK